MLKEGFYTEKDFLTKAERQAFIDYIIDHGGYDFKFVGIMPQFNLITVHDKPASRILIMRPTWRFFSNYFCAVDQNHVFKGAYRYKDRGITWGFTIEEMYFYNFINKKELKR